MFTTNIARRIYYFSKISKIVNNVSEALADVNDKAKILVGGFGICGVPMNLIAGLREKGIKDLTIVSNNCGVGDK
jgi:acyl CoA:acetate/3-ketoacid CoA transferase alpha subunit